MQIDERKIAVFIDFENVAMGVRESRYGNFDIDLVLKRLVEKGKITVKRAYSDWHRYTEFKRAFHQAAIELIDVPQSRYSGKNSADIRMVVDALDLSYQRDHIDTFVLVSGDSDFSPLVSKLREYGRYVIGMGVKQSSSDLLINNCDEFIFYEDLVRPSTENTTLAPKLNGLPRKKAEALRLVVETFEALQREGKEVIYGSVIKQTLVRKLPSFNESYFGYPSFSRLLEDAAENKLLQLTKDQKSGGYIVTLSGNGAGTETAPEESAETTSGLESPSPARKSSASARTRSSRGRRQGAREKAKSDPQPPVEATPVDPPSGSDTRAMPETSEPPAEAPLPGEAASAEQSTEPPSATEQSTEPSPPAEKKPARPRRRSSRSRAAGSRKTAVQATEESPAAEASATPASAAPAPEVPAVPPDQPPAAAPPDQPAENAAASAASPAEGQSEVEQLPPGDTTPAESSTEPSPAVEKKPARPRRRSSRSRAAGGRKAAAKAAEESPSTEASATPAPEVPAAPPDQVPAAAPPDQPAVSASASAASPAEGQSEVEQLPPGDTTPAEQSTGPSPAVEKKPARPRRRSSRSRAAGGRKAAAKAAEESPSTEASATPAPEVPAAPPDQVPAAAPPDQPAESISATAPPSEEGQASVAEASPMEAPPAAAPLLSEAGAPTTESDSDGGTAPKRRKRTTTPRKRTTRSKTTRSRKKPAPDTEPTLFSQMQDGLD